MRWRNVIAILVLAVLVGFGVIAVADTTKLLGDFNYDHAQAGAVPCLDSDPAIGSACVDSFEIGIEKSDGTLEPVGTIPATGALKYTYNLPKVLTPGIYTVYCNAHGRFRYGSGQQAYVVSGLARDTVFGGFHAPFNFTARAE